MCRGLVYGPTSRRYLCQTPSAEAARAPVLNDMPKKSLTTEAAGRFLGKLTSPQNPPSLKLAIFVSVVVLVTFLLWLLTWLNLL